MNEEWNSKIEESQGRKSKMEVMGGKSQSRKKAKERSKQ